jgi:hypothetical protein
VTDFKECKAAMAEYKTSPEVSRQDWEMGFDTGYERGLEDAALQGTCAQGAPGSGRRPPARGGIVPWQIDLENNQEHARVFLFTMKRLGHDFAGIGDVCWKAKTLWKAQFEMFKEEPGA